MVPLGFFSLFPQPALLQIFFSKRGSVFNEAVEVVNIGQTPCPRYSSFFTTNQAGLLHVGNVPLNSPRLYIHSCGDGYF